MGNSNTNTNSNMSLRTEIENEIGANEVTIYSKTYCPYCIRAKDAIKGQNVQYKVIELDVSCNN